MHEVQIHDEKNLPSSFITLTYDPENLPQNGSLNKKHFQKFIKSLRKRTKQKIRYYHCGEYGDALARPHYHAILFGYDFPDKEPFFEKKGQITYTSELLTKTWKKGHATIGTATIESAAYVARYCMKKINGDQAEHHYKRLNPATGELTDVIPEYATMSLKPAIGREWFEKYMDDIYPHGFAIGPNLKKMKPPKYYERLFKELDPEAAEQLRKARLSKAKEQSANSTPERLATRERVMEQKLDKLIRNLHDA